MALTVFSKYVRQPGFVSMIAEGLARETSASLDKNVRTIINSQKTCNSQLPKYHITKIDVMILYEICYNHDA